MGQGRLLRPKHGGTESYWAYPTGPFKQPNVAVLNPKNGNVENASDQPLPTYNPNDPNSSNDTPGAPPGKASTWCPPRAGSSCGNLPPDLPAGVGLPAFPAGQFSWPAGAAPSGVAVGGPSGVRRWGDGWNCCWLRRRRKM